MGYKNIEDQRAYHRKWYAANKTRRKELVVKNKVRLQKLIQDFKTSSGCIDCGYNSHPEALDFDHIVGKKSFGICELPNRGWSWEKIQEEINKCEVVCANCHRVRTAERRLLR